MRLFSVLATNALLFVAGTARAQDDPNIIYFGVGACKNCHEKEANSLDNRLKLSQSDAIYTSRQLEYHVWSEFDKHKDAAKVLSNARSKQIAALMPSLNPDLKNEPRCANCHGVYIDPLKEEKLIHQKTFQGEDRIASGVSCVMCHGPNKKWVNEHVAPLPEKEWSSRSRAEKKKDFGLNDLWNPIERSNLCFSCHIGNLQQGKLVTHEMYAAGHPPLPGIEIAAFSEAMPAHWETLTQKAARARHLAPNAKNGRAFLKNAYGVDADDMEMEETRLAAVSGLVALRTAVQLMGDYAGEALEPKAVNRPWPELAFYDCYACHHDLKSKSWRLDRPFAGKPGRPSFRPWPYALARFGDRLLDPGPLSLDPALAKWNRVFGDRPFGNARQVATEAKILAAIVDERINLLASKKFDRAMAKRAALTIVDLAKSELHDFDSARQFAWALRTIEAELLNDGAYSLLKPGESPFKGPLAAPFADLEKSLQLRLPEGQVEVANMLESVFGQISAYNPRAFHKVIDEIGKARAP